MFLEDASGKKNLHLFLTPKCHLGVLCAPLGRPQCSLGHAKCLQECLECLQECPKCLQERPKCLQECPKTRPK